MASKSLIVIDGHDFRFTPGETILDVAQRNGIDIPTLCYLRGASPTGACRLCLVEVEGARNLVASCAAPAAPNMVISTESERVLQSRRINLELLLASGNHSCVTCEADGDCRLQELAVKYQVETHHLPPVDTPYPVEDINPCIIRDFSRCILCGRCVKACNEIQVNNVIDFGYEGSASKIVTKGDLTLKDSDCVFCGECVQVCPVGALVPKHDLFLDRSLGEAKEAKKVRTICSYCGVGCQIYLHVNDNRVIKVSGVEDVGPNYGSLCVKGRFGFDFIGHPDRLTAPLIKENGEFREASWDEALDLVAEKLGRIKKESGPDTMGLLTSARMTNEENYMAQKFARAVIGTNNVDHCARL